jgi:cupin 2 domain-containing protein
MIANLFNDIPANLTDELFTTLLAAANFHIERIISHSHASPERISGSTNPPAHEIVR